MTDNDPCSTDDGGFSLFASALPAKKMSKSGRKTKGTAGANGDGVSAANGNANDDNVIVEGAAAPPHTPAASTGPSKVTEDDQNDEDDAAVTFKSLGLSDWLCRYAIFGFF